MSKEKYSEDIVDNHNQSGIQCRGVVLHRLLRTFEAMASGLRERGFTREQADYHALYTAFRLEGWSAAEAKASASQLTRK